MTTDSASPVGSHGKGRIVIERTLSASIDKVWKLWTTKEGLEKWWGPDGFRSEVQAIDLRAGGHFVIAMTAVLPQIVEMLKKGGMPATSTTTSTYAEVTPQTRLGYANLVDFVPGQAPYETKTTVELTAHPGGGTKLVDGNDAMHDDMWTKRAKDGWTSQLEKLAAIAGA